MGTGGIRDVRRINEMLQYFKLAIKNITQRKLRSWLTIIGIIIGIAAIVSLISISNGMEHAISEQFERFGIDIITVMPADFMGSQSAVTSQFSDRDVKTIEKVSGLKYVIPLIMQTAKVSFHNQEKYLQVFAYEASPEIEDIWEALGFEAEKGRFPREGQGKVVGLGSRAATDLFNDEIHVRNNIYINDAKFKVTGIAKEIGNSQDDNSIFMPLDAGEELFNETDYTGIMIIAKEGVDVDGAADRIERRLENHRDDKDFQVMTASQIIERISGILAIIQLVLVGIAGISLLVGAIGIMNTMFTSVLERTRDIGVMKAIGAKNSDILTIFLLESGLLGLVGGIIGIILGMALSKLVEIIATHALGPVLKAYFPWYLILGALLFSFIVGCLSGIMPARRASKLNPVDALRYE